MLEPDRIERFNASDNYLVQAPILISFSSLKSLSLENCTLKESPDISMLLNLILVDLSNNELTKVPRTHNNPKINLQLVLNKNNIADLDEDLSSKPTTHFISLCQNPLSDDAKKMMKEMKEKKHGPSFILGPLFP